MVVKEEGDAVEDDADVDASDPILRWLGLGCTFIVMR
jgi:hypothetical protein